MVRGRTDRGDRVLEHHVVGAIVLDDDGEAIEVLHATFEVGAVHQADVHRQLLASRVVEETSWMFGCGGAGRASRIC
jgi:hypothetical protein